MGLISTLQSVTKTLLRARGFRFETRGFGRGTITLWRLTLRKPKPADAPPKRLVVIPGYGDTPLSWLPTLSALTRLKAFREAHFNELVVIEFSGYMGSKAESRAIDSADGLIAAVTEVIDDLAPHTLVGQSMGGFLSAFYASELSARDIKPSLEKLVLLCPSGMSLHGNIQAATDKMLNLLAQGDVEPFIRNALGTGPVNPLLRIPHNIIAGEFREFLLRKESVSILKSIGKHHEMNERARRIITPTHLVWGARDALIPFEASTLWLTELRKGVGARLILDTLAKGTHGLHLEAPLTVARAIAHRIE